MGRSKEMQQVLSCTHRSKKDKSSLGKGLAPISSCSWVRVPENSAQNHREAGPLPQPPQMADPQLESCAQNSPHIPIPAEGIITLCHV